MIKPLILLLFFSFTSVAFGASENAIQWNYGNIEQAFKQAKKTHKPILLYWGAKWCPPCSQLKATVFKSPSFIEKTRHFIPVYLDGDTENAQLQGERFNVMGYPTLIVLNADGAEITRIPGGMDLQRYPKVLDLSLKQSLPAADLLHKIFTQDYQPSDDELKLLAYYSWGQDAGETLGKRNKLRVFAKLSRLTSTKLSTEKYRFDAEYLTAFAKHESPSDTDKKQALNKMQQLLNQPSIVQTNPYFLVYDAKDIIISLGTENRQDLDSKLTAILTKAIASPDVTPVAKLRLYRGLLNVKELQGETPSPELKSRIRSAAENAHTNAQGKYEKIAATYAAYSLLKASKQTAVAQKLMQDALSEDTNTSYWMLVLAGIAEENEQPDEALDWYRQAYQVAKGPATRLQWGSYYIQNLTKLAPDSLDLIEPLSQQLLKETAAQNKGFHGRNTRALQRISKSLKDWAVFDKQQKLRDWWSGSLLKACVQQEPNSQYCAEKFRAS